MKGKPATADLRQPEVVAAMREVARQSQDKKFRNDVLAMLAQRFGLHPTKGQLAGAIWREGISVSGQHKPQGAAALIEARRRSEQVYRRDRRAQDPREVHAASFPGFPLMLDPRPAPAAPQARRAPIPPPPPTPVARPVVVRRSTGTCAWPIGEPGTTTYRSCGDATLPDRPYCGVHCRKAYQGFRENRRDDTIGTERE